MSSYATPTDEAKLSQLNQRLTTISNLADQNASRLNAHLARVEQGNIAENQKDAEQNSYINSTQRALNNWVSYVYSLEEHARQSLMQRNEFWEQFKTVAQLMRDLKIQNESEEKQIHHDIHMMAYILDGYRTQLLFYEGELYFKSKEKVISEPDFDALAGHKRSDIIYYSYDPDDDFSASYVKIKDSYSYSQEFTSLDAWKSYTSTYASQYGSYTGEGGTARFVTKDRYAPLDILLETGMYGDYDQYVHG